MSDDVKCFVCKGPWHIASGDLFGPQDTPFCGACVRDLVQFVKAHTARRWGKVRFYDHAFPPPPAKP